MTAIEPMLRKIIESCGLRVQKSISFQHTRLEAWDSTENAILRGSMILLPNSITLIGIETWPPRKPTQILYSDPDLIDKVTEIVEGWKLAGSFSRFIITTHTPHKKLRGQDYR